MVATIFNFYRIYGNETGNISVMVKSMKKLDERNAILTLIGKHSKCVYTYGKMTLEIKSEI